MTAPERTAPEKATSVREIEGEILAFLREELLPAGVTVDRRDGLLSDLLDSVAVLRLVSFVDETFGVTTGPQDFVVENFQSAAAIAEYVEIAREP